MVVEIVKRFKKDFKSAPGDIQRRVLEMINALEKSEKLEKSGLDVKPMEGQKKVKVIIESGSGTGGLVANISIRISFC
ncbi:hypothetical protein [Dyadobacter sp. NIV53]|uniref:hypothetical protein n=1 Tax=Dyadobacter sp. NIV53 TaxID=2861765 RepID=UPI001C8891A2|nr:hypothetical protein [Dyadobacter sp. NIV53]